ncbi:MAG: 50S ribosomal protein L22 [bacterium]
MKASLNNYRQSPRKVRLLADLVRGKTASDALRALSITPKRASITMVKLINSAVSNARVSGHPAPESLKIQMVQVNTGVTMKRSLPRARGSASKLNKRSSHVTLVLGEAPVKKTKTAKIKTAK